MNSNNINKIVKFIKTLMNEIIIDDKIINIFYDLEWNYEKSIEIAKSGKELDDPSEYYQKILYEMDIYIHANSVLICDSSEINEDIENGDYEYHIIDIDDIPDCHIIYMNPSHLMAFPIRVIIFTNKYQYRLSSDKVEIEVYPTNLGLIRKMDKSNPNRFNDIKDFLMNTDRPLISKRMIKRYFKDLEEGNIW